MKQQSRARKTLPLLKGVAPLAVVGLLLTGCVGSQEAEGEAGEGIQPGATQEEYIAALADMDPVRISIPETATEGSPLAWKSEYYADAVEEWSGGKIDVEIGYGGSITDAAGVESALADGRIQVGYFYPAMNPDAYPAITDLNSVANMASTAPLTGLLQSMGAVGEAGWSNPAIIEEIEAQGIVPLLPAVPQSPAQGLACASGPVEDLDDAAGVQVRISNSPTRDQLDAIGAIPVSVTTSEMYEGLQRGVVDCNSSSVYGSAVIGLFDLAKDFSTGDDISFVGGVATLGVNKATWDSLPAAAQQLLYDRTDAFVEGYVRMMMQSDSDGIEEIEANGGSVTYWGDDIRDVLLEQRDSVVAGLRDAGKGDVVDTMEGAHEKWGELVTDLGYTDGGTLADLPEWYADEDLDLEQYMNEFSESVLGPHRPE